MTFHRGDLLRIMVFVFIALFTMVLISLDMFTLFSLCIVWIYGQRKWAEIKDLTEESSTIDKLLCSFWPIAVLAEWRTFDLDPGVVVTKKWVPRCWHCGREKSSVESETVICFSANRSVKIFGPAKVKYCPQCGIRPHSRRTICMGRRKCSTKNCPYRR